MNRLLRNLVPVAGLLLLAVPALVFWWAGWIHVSLARGSLLEHGAIKDTTSIYVWAVLSVVYLVWVIGLLVLGIWTMDRLGYHYEPYERPPRKVRRKLWRRRAGLAYLRAQDDSARKGALAAAARDARRAATEPDDEGTTTDKAGSGGAGDTTGTNRTSDNSRPADKTGTVGQTDTRE